MCHFRHLLIINYYWMKEKLSNAEIQVTEILLQAEEWQLPTSSYKLGLDWAKERRFKQPSCNMVLKAVGKGEAGSNHFMQLFPALFCGSKNKQRSKANPATQKWRCWLIKATSESSLHVCILHYINSKLQLYMDWWNSTNKMNSSSKLPFKN